jgi:AAA15 family ATPase/GTPase
MLISFSVEGFLSMYDKVDLYFIPSVNTRLAHTRFASNFLSTPKYKIMKSAVFFGANASGKSNLLMAIERFKDIILHGIDLINADTDPVRNSYWSFGSNKKDVTFKISMYNPKTNIEYEYNLKFDHKKIVAESLKRDDIVLFAFKDNILKINEMAHVKEQDSAEKLFSKESTETCLKKLTDYMKEDISAFRSLVNDITINIKDLIPVLKRNIAFVCTEAAKKLYETNKDDVVKILQTLDSSITDICFQKTHDNNYEFMIERNKRDYQLGVESMGIKKIVNLMNNILFALYDGKVLIVDELDSSISTLTLISLFNNFINTDLNNGQFIVTSHNPFLLNKNIFHPQQLYIVNKNSNLGTEVYSVDEFKLRNDKNKLYEDYLKGKFGGING